MTFSRALTVRSLALGALGLGLASLAHAQPRATPSAKPTTSATPVTEPRPEASSARRHTNTLVHIATEIARGLDQVPAGALVAASPLAADIPAPKGDDLAVRIGSLIAGRLGVAHAHPQPSSLAGARIAAGRAASLVYLRLEIVKGELHVTADLYPVVSNAWERLRNPAPGPRAHAFVKAPIDAEVRTFLLPIVLEQAKVHKAIHEESDVLAIGCGDIDADGGNELVLSTRARVTVGKLREGKLVVLRSTPWSKLAPHVPVPMREPAASIAIPRVHRDELLIGTTDRGAVAVDPMLVARRALIGLPIPGAEDACVTTNPLIGVFEGNGLACARPIKGDPETVLTTPTARFDAIAAFPLIGKDGRVTQLVAAREPNGKLRVSKSQERGHALETLIDGVGAQVVLADLDLDGVPEVAFSSDSTDADTLSVWSWRSNGFAPRLRYPAKEGIRAIAVCPPEEKGLPALVAIVGGEVWLVR